MRRRPEIPLRFPAQRLIQTGLFWAAVVVMLIFHIIQLLTLEPSGPCVFGCTLTAQQHIRKHYRQDHLPTVLVGSYLRGHQTHKTMQ